MIGILVTKKLNELTVEDAITLASLGLRLVCNDGEVVAVEEV